MIWIQNQLVGAAIGQTIALECQSEAYPKSINYWMKNGIIIVPGLYIHLPMPPCWSIASVVISTVVN